MSPAGRWADAELHLGRVTGFSDADGAFVMDGVEGYDLQITCPGCEPTAVPADEITTRLTADEAVREPVTGDGAARGGSRHGDGKLS